MFNKDLKDGQDFEDSICEFVKIKYPKAYRMKGNFGAYDIFVPEKDHKLECKFDRKSETTQNIVIEFSWKGNPSGINNTEATHWIIKFYDNNKWNLAIGKTEAWKELCEGLKVVSGGDGWLSKLYLVPKVILYKNKKIKIKEFIK